MRNIPTTQQGKPLSSSKHLDLFRSGQKRKQSDNEKSSDNPVAYCTNLCSQDLIPAPTMSYNESLA